MAAGDVGNALCGDFVSLRTGDGDLPIFFDDIHKVVSHGGEVQRGVDNNRCDTGRKAQDIDCERNAFGGGGGGDGGGLVAPIVLEFVDVC